MMKRLTVRQWQEREVWDNSRRKVPTVTFSKLSDRNSWSVEMADKPLWWQRPKKELEEKFSTLEEQVKWLTVEQEQKVWTNSPWEVPTVTFAIPSEPNIWGVKMADTDATATSQDNSEEGVKAHIKQTIDHLLNHRVTPVQRRDLRRATDQAERTSSAGDAAIGRITTK